MLQSQQREVFVEKTTMDDEMQKVLGGRFSTSRQSPSSLTGRDRLHNGGD